MNPSYSPILSVKQLDGLFNFANLDRSVELACQLAVQHPKALYLFMQRYTHFNGYAGSLVARLASSVGLSRHLFNSSSNLVVDEADRGLEIAAKILAEFQGFLSLLSSTSVNDEFLQLIL